VAVVPASGSPLYYAEDMLGSSRVLVQSNGTLCYDADFTPFGAERPYTSTCPQNYKFEGKERDGETQNDEFGARYYSWRVGRGNTGTDGTFPNSFGRTSGSGPIVRWGAQAGEIASDVRNPRSICNPFAGLTLLSTYFHAIRGLACC
jgi:hypothetical protein